MQTLSIDIETRSGADLKKAGVFRYIDDPDFSIIIVCYQLTGGPMHTVDIANGEEISPWLRNALIDPAILKTAHNVQFEFNCLQKHFNIKLDISQWDCTMIRGGSLSLPLGLDAVGKALRLPQQKDYRGKSLIRIFCNPDKETGAFTEPWQRPKEWEEFKKYCAQDVIVEVAVRMKILQLQNMNTTERAMYVLDQKINARGIAIDIAFAQTCVDLDAQFRQSRINEARELTGLSNPNSIKTLIKWLTTEMDEEVDSLKKADIPRLLKKSPSDVVTRVLKIRQELSKTSVSKYKAMLTCVCTDGRIRGLHQMYGASRTARFAGRLVQPQNLPRNSEKPLDIMRQLAKSRDTDWLQTLFGSLPGCLSQLIRTAFVPKKGHRFITSDFSAIEAVVIAWLADEKWRLDVFRTHGEIYEASASMMFGIPIELIDKESPYRAQGKVAELALGFGGSEAAIAKMDTKNEIPPQERLPLVYRWRDANKKIVALWKIVNDAVIDVLTTGQQVNLMKGIKITLEKGVLFIHLPSGRKITYLKPRLGANKFGGVGIFYEGQNQTTNKWEEQETYGGKLVENIVQAFARDLLVAAMLRVDAAGWPIVLHVHDEIVTEMPFGRGSVEELNALMAAPVEWAPGIPVRAAGFESYYYKKD